VGGLGAALNPAHELAAYRGRRVLVTGHTGFKGSWLSLWLSTLGAQVSGYSLAPPTEPDLFTAAGVREALAAHTIGDVRDLDAFSAAWRRACPEIVFHLAAQPLVRESYRDPLTTVGTNVLGVANALDLARREPPRAIVVVTSDKCYENREWPYPYRETDALGGHDVYSASKAAAELIASAFRRSFLRAAGVAVATVRAGNVIGGGDWAADRLVPDCIRALASGRPIRLRSRASVRPWQHVLEPLSGYLLLGARLLASAEPSEEAPGLADAWNFGPAGESSRTVGDLVDALIAAWGEGRWEQEGTEGGGHEAGLLRLAIDKARAGLGWAPRWDFAETVDRTVSWYRSYYAGEPGGGDRCRDQIAAYVKRTEP
jgi:CDP-glucose 4,6-dehydratase